MSRESKSRWEVVKKNVGVYLVRFGLQVVRQLVYEDSLKLALINYIEDRSGMQKIFSFQLCRPCNQNQLLEEKRQEQIAQASRHSGQSYKSTETVLSQTASSAINTLSSRQSPNIHYKQQLIEVRRPIAKVSCRKAGQKQNKPAKSKHLEIGPPSATTTQNIGITFEKQLYLDQEVIQCRWPKTPYGKQDGLNEKGFFGNLPLNSVAQATKVKIKFEYRSFQHDTATLKPNREDQCVRFVQSKEVKIVSFVDQQDIEEQTDRKRLSQSRNHNIQKQVKFNNQDEINIYTIKTITQWQPIIESEGSRPQQPPNIHQSSYSLTSCHQSYVDILQPEQPTPPQQNYHQRVQEHCTRPNRPWLRKDKKIMTAFVPSEPVGRTHFRTVQTIKSIDNGSQGSIVDSTFMRTVAESKELRTLF